MESQTNKLNVGIQHKHNIDGSNQNMQASKFIDRRQSIFTQSWVEIQRGGIPIDLAILAAILDIVS